MSREVLLDLGFLTEDERDLINNVISKDAEIRKAEQGRIGSLRKELDELKENGLSEDELESKNEKYCARCQTYFGIILNRGAYCPRCELKVCKVCRVNDIDDGWICTLCNKVREVKAQSGAWFFQGHKEKNGNLFGSLLVRQSLRRLPGIQPKGHKEPSNPFIEDEEPSNPFIEDEEPSNPFTSGNRGRSSERLSGQADLNSNQAKWNGGHKMGYQYSDDSDEDSEQRSRDGSLEYKHDDTASDRTLSKGESDSSESLDSDHDVTLATNADELSPVATREMALRAKPNTAKRDGHSGGNVEQQGLPKDTEYEFGISKDTQDIRDRPPSFNQNAHQSGGNIVQKKLVGYTKSDEGTIRNTQKVRSRPGSLSLDEDMSYVSAPRFNIPLKRRQSSGSLPISEARSDEGFEKHRCRSEEYLSKSERMLDRNEPSADVIIACKKTRDEIKDQNISGTLEDVFGTGESNYKDIEIDLKDENKGDMFDMRDELSADDISPEAESDEETQDDDGRLEFSIHEDTVCKESGIVVECSPEILSENFSADNIAADVDMDEFTRDDDETAHKESGIVVDSSPNVDQPKQLSEQDFEIPSTDEKRKGSYDDSISDSDARQNGLATNLPSSGIAENENSPGNVVGDIDDNTEVLSVFSRVKNWERRSTEDRFGVDVKEENRKSFNNQGGETMKDKYEITIDSSENNKEIAVPAAAERVEDTEHRQTRDLSPVGNASVDDMPFINEGPSESVDKEPSPSPEVLQTSGDLEMELQRGSSYEKNDISLDKISPSEVMQDEFPSENITVETSTNSGKTEMELQQESDDDTSSDNVNPSEAILDEVLDEVPSENITVETSLNLEKTEMELQQESDDDITSDSVNPGEAMQNYSLPKHITTPVYEMQVEDSESKTAQGLTVSLKEDIPEEEESSINSELKSEFKSNLDFSSSNSDSSLKTDVNLTTSSSLKSDTFVDNEVPRMSAHLEKEKTGTSPSDSEDDVHKFDEKEKTSPSDSEDDVHKSDEKEKTSPSDSEDDVHKSDDETKPLRDLEIRTDLEMSATNQDTRPEPHTSETTVVQSANEEEPASPESRINAMRAFSEAFATTNLGMKGHESHEDREKHEDHGYREESGHHEDSETREDRDTYEDRDTREDREHVEDQETREDRGYHAGQYAPEERGSSEDAREDRGYREENVGPDSRRSSDLHYEGFHGDNESMISETSGYGTPSASEDTSSKRTPSISGDEGMNTPTEEARRLPSESAPIIVTTEAADEAVLHDANSFRDSSITDFEEDLDVSFSKYGTGLGNRMLKDQLSMGSRESIVSYYSNAGGEVYGKYPVSGEILFGIKYDPKIQEFQIQIHQGRDITAVDKKTETSDPYVKTYLLPDRSRTGKRKSKVKKNTVNPVFDEILTYKITYDEILQRTLWLAIWNHDTFGHNDFLGEVLVPIDQYHQSGFSLEDPEPQWYELCERQADDQQFSYNGEIVFSLKYVPPSALVSNKKKKKKKKADDEKGELHINIIEATNLLAKDANGFSDPFCKSYLLPDKSKKSKQKTPVVKKSLNPKWNYHFVYDNVTHEELMDRVLELTIWDFDRGSSNEFLGGVRLGLGTGVQEWDDATSEEQAAWNKMLNNQNDWNQVSLILREHMGRHKSAGFYSPTGLDPNLVEIKPIRPPLDPLLAQTLSESPDDQLIRHHEYHSPHESKIAAAMRLSQEKLSNQLGTSHGAKTMTLAELAGSSPKKREQSSLFPTLNSAAPRSTSRSSVPSSSASPLNASRTSTPEVITEESSPLMDNSAGSLVRHSEFYKGSTSGIRRPSSEISFQAPRERGGSTLSDLIQQGNVDNDSLLGSDLSVNEGWMGSRESIYSNDGVYGNHDVSGEILLSYQYFKGSFKVKIFEARGLTAVDKNTSNPYVKVYLLPDQSRTGKRKTKMKHATLDPEFNQEMLYKISTADLVRRTLWISVWHYDRFGRNEFLGEVQIPLGDYQGSEVAPDWYPLVPTQSKASENEQGELVVALMYSPADKKRKSGQGAGKLYVKIIEGKNLPGKDADGLSDPFCKSYLLPDPEKKSKRKTPVKKRNLNPRWDYKFSYDDMTIDDLQHRVLELTVWDHDLGTSNDFIGGVRIGLGTSDKSWDDCTGEEVTLWQFLLSKPNTWAESTLPLRSEMGSRKGLRT